MKIYITLFFLFGLSTAGSAQERKTTTPSPPPPLDCENCNYENPNPFRVVIDPGHGGRDTGAQSEGVNEKDINLAISKKLGELLQ
ncbi:MAG: N-acetylmuramoyl-L-alanine amidase, partial [Planctomycetota bacterium]|nr:N-acetylmuramoyl-L-alanine amidase [Planctomycetota bacterium]